MPGPLRVRAAAREDLAALVAFNRALARETEDRDLDPAVLERGVAAVLADPARGRYLVAERDGAAVGCTLLTTEWSDWRDGLFWWIQSVYVAPEARGAGVFRALYRHVEDEARRTPEVCGLRLYVERANERAQAVYERLGMHRTGYLLYETDLPRGA